MRKLLATTALVAGTVGLAATSVAAAPPSAGKTIVGTALELSGGSIAYDDTDGDFDVLLAVATALDLAPALSGNRQLTVFAPTDGAFRAAAGAVAEKEVAEDEVAGVLIDALGADGVRQVVLDHITPGRRTASSVVPATELSTLGGGGITKAPGTALDTSADPDGAEIVIADVAASNGIIHAIDAVLLP